MAPNRLGPQREGAAGLKGVRFEAALPASSGGGSESNMRCKRQVWRNWEGNHECVAEVCRASSLDDLQDIVKKAIVERKSVRASGGGRDRPGSASYSVRSIVKNEGGIIVKLASLNKGYDHDDGSGWVTVEAGMTIAELEDLVAKNHLSFEAMLVPPIVEVG